ncbi:sialate O-acetylesterase [Algibacter mikhailovii]|uniref:sialate O-acetylesterase n=1 Tax=Algibacter mikhailovii TaxID=425498 RepID=UPI002494C553|nr:sialate O-acetylesterase [Algibacter mikhailovii]
MKIILNTIFNLICWCTISLQAQISLPAFFGDNMVIQQKEIVSIWGKDIPNTTINLITSWGSTAKTVSNAQGEWHTSIKTGAASFQTETITIIGSNRKTIKNILIGEVWFCSGQSNMEMPLNGFRKSPVLNAHKYMAIADNTNIRLFNNPRTASVSPNYNVDGRWAVSSATSAKTFSAVGYMFGAKLYENLNVPIGIIESSWGGTKIECWIPKAYLLKTKSITIPVDLSKEEAKQKKPSFLYNAMIHPFKDFKVKGVLWYQGESNRLNPHAYRDHMKDLIKSWRSQWKEDDLPFYFVQIAPFDYVKYKKATTNGPDLIREAQLKAAFEIHNTGLVVTTDAGNCSDIHPSKKELIAQRLVNWALTEQYHFKHLQFKSAVLEKMAIKKEKVLLKFKFQENDYFIKSDDVKGFAIASNDQVFYPAKVSFNADNKTLIIHSDKVKDPVAIRYGFEDCFESNLKTKSGLPIPVFRTDVW